MVGSYFSKSEGIGRQQDHDGRCPEGFMVVRMMNLTVGMISESDQIMWQCSEIRAKAEIRRSKVRMQLGRVPEGFRSVGWVRNNLEGVRKGPGWVSKCWKGSKEHWKGSEALGKVSERYYGGKDVTRSANLH